MGIYALLPGRENVGSTPDGYQDLTLTASDGVDLQAWYRPPENGAAIILLHGAGSSRQSVLPYAAMLARHGYGVLAVDLRGHGASGGKTNRLGWQGNRDVGAALAFLQSRSEVRSIGGLGISMGGEALLGAASEYPAIHAIAADGATRRSTAELLALPSERPLVRSFTARLMYAAVQLLSRQTPPRPLLDSMYASRPTRFLLIAAGGNELETAYNRLFAVVLGGRADLWVAPSVEHTGAFARYPQEYEQRLIQFFDAALLGQ
jgi:pimeloyl-ACP methyl ester carboxylesterase